MASDPKTAGPIPRWLGVVPGMAFAVGTGPTLSNISWTSRPLNSKAGPDINHLSDGCPVAVGNQFEASFWSFGAGLGVRRIFYSKPDSLVCRASVKADLYSGNGMLSRATLRSQREKPRDPNG